MAVFDMNVELFKANFKRGARPNKFYVQVQAPAVLEALGVDIPDKVFEFFCKSAEIPDSAVGSIDQKYMGHTIPTAGDPAHSHDLPLKVINEEDFRIRNFLKKWNHLIHHPIYGVATTAPVYEGRFIVTQLDGSGNPVSATIFTHAWVQTVGKIVLDWDSENQIEVFDTNIKFLNHQDVNLIDFSVQGLVEAVSKALTKIGG